LLPSQRAGKTGDFIAPADPAVNSRKIGRKGSQAACDVPTNSSEYVAGLGTVSKMMTYSNNRADNSYIPGAVIPGYIIIKPDFPECIDDFGFLWFEDEAVVAGSASWVAGNAAP
jgi:hypothetical protein